MNTRNKNWGKGFIEAVSEQLRKELPGLRGFSAASLRKRRTGKTSLIHGGIYKGTGNITPKYDGMGKKRCLRP